MARDIAEIQADLTAAYESRRTALQAQNYSLDTGQGKQSVTRASLSEINKTIRELQAELEEAQNAWGGLMTGSFERY